MSDRDLIDRALLGDEAAWERLFERYAPLVRYVAKGGGLSAAHADDVVQLTFLRLLENDSYRLRLWRGIDNFAAYLRAVAARVAIDVRRAAGMRPVPLIDDLQPSAGEGPESREEDPERRFLAEERAAAVRSVLAGLSPADVDLFQWHYVDGMSATDIALLQGRAANAVHQALRALKRRVGPRLGRSFPELFEGGED